MGYRLCTKTFALTCAVNNINTNFTTFGNLSILNSSLYISITLNLTAAWPGSEKQSFSCLNMATKVVTIINVAPQKYKYPEMTHMTIYYKKIIKKNTILRSELKFNARLIQNRGFDLIKQYLNALRLPS